VDGDHAAAVRGEVEQRLLLRRRDRVVVRVDQDDVDAAQPLRVEDGEVVAEPEVDPEPREGGRHLVAARLGLVVAAIAEEEDVEAVVPRRPGRSEPTEQQPAGECDHVDLPDPRASPGRAGR
jgi:hypothetical protein